MRIIFASIVAAGLALSGSAFAQSAALDTGIDTDRNGLISWAEFSLVYEDVDEGTFNQADADGDGFLNAMEFDNLALATGSVQPSMSGTPSQLAPESLTSSPE